MSHVQTLSGVKWNFNCFPCKRNMTGVKETEKCHVLFRSHFCISQLVENVFVCFSKKLKQLLQSTLTNWF